MANLDRMFGTAMSVDETTPEALTAQLQIIIDGFVFKLVPEKLQARIKRELNDTVAESIRDVPPEYTSSPEAFDSLVQKTRNFFKSWVEARTVDVLSEADMDAVQELDSLAERCESKFDEWYQKVGKKKFSSEYIIPPKERFID